MLKLANLKDMTDEDVVAHIISNYEDDGYNGYGRLGKIVSKETLSDCLKNYDILVAYESVGSWGCDSSSFFILRNKVTSSLAWVSGSHCSCYGFEGQFNPEDMPDEWFLRDDFCAYSYGGYDDDEEANKQAVKEWVKQNIKKENG